MIACLHKPVALLPVAMLALGPATIEAQMFRSDAQHSGLASAAGVPVLHGVKWQYKTGAALVSSPIVSGDAIYFGSNDHNLYALDKQTGALRWKFPTKGRITATPAVVEGRVYFGSYDSQFYALDAAKGTLLWKFSTAGERHFSGSHLHGAQPAAEVVPDPFDVFLSSPAVVAGAVYFGSGDGNVYALDAASGTLRWKFHTGEDPDTHNQQGIQSSAVVADGTVYFGCRDSHLYALDARSGTKRWEFSTGDSWVVSSPAVRSGVVYFATSDSGLVEALDARTGQTLFSLDFNHWPFFSSPTIAGDLLYIGSHQGRVLAIDLGTHKVRWTFATEEAQRNAVPYTNANGTPNYRAAVSDSFYDQLAIGNDRLMNIGAILSTPAVDGDTVYFGSWDGNLYAIG
jgi:eukaryotic-like serine/threonine-protein kinase